jgi:hypothetical protein
MPNYHNQSDEQLIGEIENLRSEGLHLFASICERLWELDKRKYKHPLHTHIQFRHFRAVASEKLLPAIVVMFNGGRAYTDCFSGRPLDIQKSVASGRPFDVAMALRIGGVSVRSLPVQRMNQKTIQLMFPPGAPVRTVFEQKVLLEAELATKPETHRAGKPLIRAGSDKESFIVGGTTIPLSVFTAAARELGYKLEKIGE